MHRNNFFCDWLYRSLYLERNMLAIALSFAEGAILVMLGESMIPEAYEQGGASIVGPGIMVGFSLAFILGNV
jgi:zinc transporter ZupT